MDNQKRVIATLLENNWYDDGLTAARQYKIITQDSYPLAGGTIKQGGKPRMKKCDWKVSVGKRTTYFYRREKGKPYYEWEGKGFPTKNIDDIIVFINKRRT